MFSEMPSVKREAGKAKTLGAAAGESKGERRMSVSRERKSSGSAATGVGGGGAPVINIPSPEGEPLYYHWCVHHQSVLL